MGTTIFPLCNGGPLDDDGPHFPSPAENTMGGQITRMMEARRQPKKFMKAAEGQKNPARDRAKKMVKPRVTNLASESGKPKKPRAVPAGGRKGVRVSESAGRLPDGSGFFTGTVSTPATRRKRESRFRRHAAELAESFGDFRRRRPLLKTTRLHTAVEVAPPGREDQVRDLKKKKNVDNPFAVSWASYNKSHED